MSVEISTKGILPDFKVAGATENLNGKVWDRLNSLTIKAELVQRLLKKGKQKERFFLLSDNKFSENGFRDPTRTRTMLLVNEPCEVFGYVIRFHPIKHNPYFLVYSVTPNKQEVQTGLDKSYPAIPPSWWPTEAQSVPVYNSNCALDFKPDQAQGAIFEFPHDADFESIIQLRGYKL